VGLRIPVPYRTGVVVIRVAFSYWFSGSQWFTTQSPCSR